MSVWFYALASNADDNNIIFLSEGQNLIISVSEPLVSLERQITDIGL